MEAINMKYGRNEIYSTPPVFEYLGLIQSKAPTGEYSEEQVIQEALENPIGSGKLREIVKPGEKICIVISDTTRTWQKMDLYLPYIVKELNDAGVEDHDISFLCATGSHRPQTEEEHRALLGDKLSGRFRVKDHDCRRAEELVKLGTTSLGTPVIVNRLAVESDHVILTGAVVFHDLAGWGGGKKSILPGISAYESIMANHALSLSPELGKGINPLVRCGNAINNPVHLDMMEAAAFVNPSFLFNVIIDERGNIGKAVAGDYIKAHEAGRKLVDEIDSAYIGKKADMVLVSAGGYPKDINLYQASKALINAKEAVRDGGYIILLAECIEGFGGEEVRLMLEDYCDNCSREKAVRESFTVAKYTGYLITEIAEHFKVILVSSIDPKRLINSGIKSAGCLQEAMNMAASTADSKLSVYIMPSGSSTLPRLSS
ncbi:MAG: nickel-dependent lactate racemase [Pseudomonadota bacterium]